MKLTLILLRTSFDTFRTHLAISGDTEAARQTQIAFAKNVESLVDKTPVVGHVKGGIHLALGDKERGEDILKEASRTTAALVGGIAGGVAGGGPAGAVASGIAAGKMIKKIENAVNEKKDLDLIDLIDQIKL